jgi:hypothetical protein
MSEDNLPQFKDEVKTFDKQRMDQISRFLQPTIPRGEEDRYRVLKPLIGKEMSMGNIMREDMNSNDLMNYGIQELFMFGQEDLAFMFLTNFTAEFKMTMSIDHIMIDGVTKSKIEYDQTYTVHEHQHPPENQKKGFLRR